VLYHLSHTFSLYSLVIFWIGSCVFLNGTSLGPWFFYLCLLCSWDYMCAPSWPALSVFLEWVETSFSEEPGIYSIHSVYPCDMCCLYIGQRYSTEKRTVFILSLLLTMCFRFCLYCHTAC
jgi:hypothetical protein